MIVSRFAIVTEDLVICCYQVTKICSSRYGLAIASSARDPCNFSPLTDFASMNIVFTQILTSLCSLLSRCFMRRTGVRISLYWSFIIHQISPEFLQPFRNLRIVTQVSPFDRGLFLLSFRNLVGLDFHRFPPFYHQQIWTLALERCHC